MAKNWPGSLHPRELECHVFFSRLLQIQSTLRIVPGKETKEYNRIVFIKHQSLNLLDRNTSWFFIWYNYKPHTRTTFNTAAMREQSCQQLRPLIYSLAAGDWGRGRDEHTPRLGDIRRPTVNDLLHCHNLQEQKHALNFLIRTDVNM